MNKEIKIKIQSQTDRDNVIIALVNNGYCPKVEIEDNVFNKDYYIIFKPK